MFAVFRVALRDLRRRDDVPVHQERGKEPKHGSGAVGTGKPAGPVVKEPRMTTGAVVGKKATLNAFMSLPPGECPTGRADDEVPGTGPARSDHRTCVSCSSRESRNCIARCPPASISGGTSAARSRAGTGEPERKRPALPTGLPAGPTSARGNGIHGT